MAQVRTLTQLQEALDEQMGWRIKEIADLKEAANRRKVFVRAGVTILYAHWEGFIKGASILYLSFVENQNITYRDLKTCFAVFGLKGKLNTLVSSRQSNASIKALDFLIAEMDAVASMSISNAIDTESNLGSNVFENIALSLDLDRSSYQTKYNLIDESLVKRRNKIAHGEYLDLDGREFRKLADEVLLLMRSYKTDLENAASLQSYLRLPCNP